ncbi:MAG: tRNA pseudouridine(38-40) synthase TruA [Dehalococcoidia bacterium]|nr:tRNA pseudouridine(38-40) synthase TruA [Dehalococcoidia bacterium]
MDLQRFAATVSYDGRAFAGSQRQPNGRTVQEELERAAAVLFGGPTRVDMAGRTDTGVHAIGQVAAFSVVTALPAATVGRALNAHLPEDVSVRDVASVLEGFDPRRWARRRWYRYTVHNAEVRAPLLRQRAWHVPGTLAVGAMQAAASALTGRRDCSACAGALEPGRNPVRTVFAAGWVCESDLLLFDIEADAFLPQMVRRLVGALIRVGRGTLEGEEFVRLLAQARPGSLGPSAPPQGLCLQRVAYDEGYLP